MRYPLVSLTLFVILCLGGLTYGHPVAARNAQGETQTPSDTPEGTITPTPVDTGTPDLTGTPEATITPTPDVYWRAQLSSGQAVEIKFSMTAGEILIAVLLAITIGILIGLAYLVSVKK